MNVAETYTIPYRPTECVAGGRALADSVGSAYRELDPTAMVTVGGSVARGDADRYSDLELFVYGTEPPSAEGRRNVVAHLGGELWTMDRNGETMEHFGIGRLRVGDSEVDGTSMISVTHYRFEVVEAALHRVFDELATDPEDHAFLVIVRDAIPLSQKPRFEALQARIAAYPEALSRKVVVENLGFGPWFIPHALAARGDRLTLHAHMHVIERHLLRVLAALNRTLVAFPTGKWARRSDTWLAVRPVRFRERLDAAYGSDLSAGWNEMRTLMMEAIDLVEHTFSSALQTAEGDDACRWARCRWDPLPPYTLMLDASRNL